MKNNMKVNSNKCYTLTAGAIRKQYLLIDASNLILGRLAVVIATLLRGKNKADYSPHLDCGARVIVINARKIRLTGDKLKQHIHYRHSGYPGGIKQETARESLTGRHPDRLLRRAVARMIPKGPLGHKQLRQLFIYAEAEHPHADRKPQLIDVAAMNRKNSIS